MKNDPTALSVLILASLISTLNASKALATPPRQFYTNGSTIDSGEAWDYQPNQSQSNTPSPPGFNFTGPFVQTWHFYRPNANDMTWKQQYLRQYEKDPEKRVFYFNVETSVWTGYWDHEQKKYRKLPPDFRHNDLRMIPPNVFLPPGEAPKLSELGKKPCCHPVTNDETIVDEPPEFDFESLVKPKK